MKNMQFLRKERHDKPKMKTPCKHCKHGVAKPSRKEIKKHDNLKGVTIPAMDEIKHSPRNEVCEQTWTSKTRFYHSQRILWHLRHKIPGPGKFKVRWAGPYLIKQIYDNGSLDVTTLQGESLGRVNMNKLKPYQEPDTTQAYTLQILAWHILEAEIRAKQNHLHKRSSTPKFPIATFSQSNEETISDTESTPYQDQKTLDAEDLDIH